jgi:hypothetical protein
VAQVILAALIEAIVPPITLTMLRARPEIGDSVWRAQEGTIP